MAKKYDQMTKFEKATYNLSQLIDNMKRCGMVTSGLEEVQQQLREHEAEQHQESEPKEVDDFYKELIWLYENSCNDFLGTGSNNKRANEEEKEWHERFQKILKTWSHDLEQTIEQKEVMSLLYDFPENKSLYKDSGLWQLRSDDMDDILIQQGVNESDANFINRCKEQFKTK